MINVHYEVILLRFSLSDYKKMLFRKYKFEIKVYFGRTSLQKNGKGSPIVGCSCSIYRSMLWSSYAIGGSKLLKYLQNIMYESSLEGRIRSVMVGVRSEWLWSSLVAGQNRGGGHARARVRVVDYVSEHGKNSSGHGPRTHVRAWGVCLRNFLHRKIHSWVPRTRMRAWPLASIFS